MGELPPDARPYRRGVGVMLINRDGLVWVGQRLGPPDAWQMPQGGIDTGESPREAALRELAEETAARTVDVIAQAAQWLCYDLPPDLADRVWKARYRGQQQLWFALRFLGDDRELDVQGVAHPEFAAWRWAPVDDLPALIVPFKRALYEAVVSEFRHLARPAP